MPTRIAPLAAALAVLALAAAFAAPRAAAEEPADAEAASTVTTLLRPGWNMAAWLGEDAPVQALFDAVPELDYARAWDAETQRERGARPRSILRNGLTRLTTGMGLWLRVGGDAPVEWTREAAPGSVLLELREGRNRVGWTGRDGAPAAEALARFGETLVAASRWNAETQRHERYRPGAAEEANTLRALSRGDALEVDLTSDARWWQSGTARTKFEFLGGVPEQRQAEIRAETAEVLAFYAERYGIVPPEFTILVDPALDIAADANGRRIRIGRHIVNYPLIGGTIAHEYTHVLQHSLQGLPLTEGSSSPAWLIEGQATYAGGLFFQSRGDRTGDRQRSLWWREALDVTLLLRDLAGNGPFYAEGGAAYALGALATEWLVARAEAREAEQSGGAPPASGGLTEHESHIRYWEAVPSPERWSEAFEASFGVAVDDFYDAFEAYRADGLALHAPHRFDDRYGPLLVFVGDVPDETQTAVRAELERIRAFFSDRFGTSDPEFTIYVGPDASSLAETHLRAFGEEIEDGFHGRATDSGMVSIIALDGAASPPHSLDWHYHYHVRSHLAPSGSLPDAPDGYDRRGPVWLWRGVWEYVKASYRSAAGIEPHGAARVRHISSASRAAQSLGVLETQADAAAAGSRTARALGFLAAERLAALAGEPALFEYYAALPDAADWREAFEAAFGIAPDTFYADFDAYSVEAAPLLPHLADDRDEPVLVFLGDAPADEEAEARAEFERLRAFYADRFAVGALDFTIYVGADTESAAAPHLLVFGEEIPDGFCDRGREEASVVALDCADGRGWQHHFRSHYLFRVRTQLAPWGSLAEAAEGYDRRGPYWLLRATERYTEIAYEAATGQEPPDRSREIAFARRSAQPLGGMETREGASEAWPPAASALGFLAVEQLVRRAGEPALFEYYAALPDAADWREAFEAAFGLSVDAFYADFEAYRAHVAPPSVLHELRGVVLDPGGAPLAAAWVGASRGEPDWEHTATTAADGAFALRVRDGRYGLTLDMRGTRCRLAEGHLIWGAARAEVAGADVSGIVVRLPDDASCGAP